MMTPIMRRGRFLIVAGFLSGLALSAADVAHGTIIAAEPVGPGEFSLAAGFDSHAAEPGAGAEATDSGTASIPVSCVDDADEPERRSALCADAAVGNLVDAGFPLIGSASRPAADLGAAALAMSATSAALSIAPMQTPFAGLWSMANGGSVQFMAEMDPGPVATRVDFAVVHNNNDVVGYAVAALAALGGLLGGWLLLMSRRRRAALARHRRHRHGGAAELLRTD